VSIQSRYYQPYDHHRAPEAPINVRPENSGLRPIGNDFAPDVYRPAHNLCTGCQCKLCLQSISWIELLLFSGCYQLTNKLQLETLQTQDSRQEDDETVEFCVGAISPTWYSICIYCHHSSLPVAVVNFFFDPCHILAQVTCMTCDTLVWHSGLEAKIIADLRPDLGRLDGHTFIGASRVLSQLKLECLPLSETVSLQVSNTTQSGRKCSKSRSC